MVVVRKLMEFVFSSQELKYLDDEMPEIHLRKREDAKKAKMAREAIEDAVEDEDRMAPHPVATEHNLHIPLASGNVMKIPLSSLHERPINISEEVNKSGVWKHIESESSFINKNGGAGGGGGGDSDK